MKFSSDNSRSFLFLSGKRRRRDESIKQTDGYGRGKRYPPPAGMQFLPGNKKQAIPVNPVYLRKEFTEMHDLIFSLTAAGSLLAYGIGFLFLAVGLIRRIIAGIKGNDVAVSVAGNCVIIGNIIVLLGHIGFLAVLIAKYSP